MVFAEHRTPGAKHTILFYAHYDGQPVTPSAWARGIAPFQPVLYSKPFEQGGQPVTMRSPNPAWRLVQLLATMRDTSGHVLIKDWYTDVVPFTPEEQAAVNQIPPTDAELAVSLGLARPEGNGESITELLNQPSLNINGIQSADVGALSRIVSGAGYNAQRTPLALPFAQALIRAVQTGITLPLIVLPGTGGSLPLKIIKDKMGVHLMLVPIANYDDNQHAENENLRLQNLWNGILEYKGIMSYRYE